MTKPKTNETLTVADLVRPLNLEAVMYFAQDNLPKAVGKEYQTARLGKFVRVGEVMVLGTVLDYGRPDFNGDFNYLQHWRLSRFLFEDDERAELANFTADAEPKIGGGLTDAGSTSIGVDADGVPTRLVLSFSSFDFGKANDAGRERSVEIAQLLVGDTITVSHRR